MMLDALLQSRPIMVVLAGPNGAGKTTFFDLHLANIGLRFINADQVGSKLGLSPQQAMQAADAIRSELIRQGESFITETVFSDPVGAEMSVFTSAKAQGYAVVLLFIGISGPERSDERVAIRVSRGGHDVPLDRLIARYPRTMSNLRTALRTLSAVVVFDNDESIRPYRLIARVVRGVIEEEAHDLPAWWTDIRP